LKSLCASVAVFPAICGAGELPPQIRRHCSRDASEYVYSLLRDDSVDLIHVEGFDS